jgi:hypothetical protein
MELFDSTAKITFCYNKQLDTLLLVVPGKDDDLHQYFAISENSTPDVIFTGDNIINRFVNIYMSLMNSENTNFFNPDYKLHPVKVIADEVIFEDSVCNNEQRYVLYLRYYFGGQMRIVTLFNNTIPDIIYVPHLDINTVDYFEKLRIYMKNCKLTWSIKMNTKGLNINTALEANQAIDDGLKN